MQLTAAAPGIRHQHRWELTWEHVHGTFVIADAHQCRDCPAEKWTGFSLEQGCPDCHSG